MKITLTQDEVKAAIEFYIRDKVLWSERWTKYNVLPTYTPRVMIIKVEAKEVAEEKQV